MYEYHRRAGRESSGRTGDAVIVEDLVKTYPGSTRPRSTG